MVSGEELVQGKVLHQQEVTKRCRIKPGKVMFYWFYWKGRIFFQGRYCTLALNSSPRKLAKRLVTPVQFPCDSLASAAGPVSLTLSLYVNVCIEGN